MITKFKAGLMSCLIVASGFPARVWGHCDPPCNSCQDCVDGVCVQKPGVECDEDSDCGDPFCYDCVSCNCVLVGGAECGKDADCPPEAYCDESVCTCKCNSGSCWDWEVVSGVIEFCPDCTSFWNGCEGMVEISSAYKRWVPIAPGGFGYCKNPTKTETVGFLYECTEDWDVSKILACAGGSVLCVAWCASGNWILCVVCLIVEGLECADEGVCSFVDDCFPDGDTAFPIEKEVVDFGADWGDFMKCGSE